MPTVGWRLRSMRSADCVRWKGRALPRSAARRGPFGSRGSRWKRGRPRWGPCEVGVGGLLGVELGGWWWEISPTPFRCWIRVSAEARGAGDGRLAVRQLERRRDTVFGACRTAARDAA